MKFSALFVTTAAALAISAAPVGAQQAPEQPAVEVEGETLDGFEAEIWDPIEPVNRGVFWFNDQLDIYVIEPVARGYEWLVPDKVEESIGNFFNNLRYPQYLLSDVVQFKFGQAAHHTGRFLVNTTLGLAGFFDVATHMGLEEHEEDFGVALAYHGLPPGPYLVVPIIGPTNLRDGVGRIVDALIHPTALLTYTADLSSDEEWGIALGTRTVDLIDQRAGLLDAVESAKESSLDYYFFMQSAYYQYRRGLLYDGLVSGDEDDIEFDDSASDLKTQVMKPR